MDDVAGAIADPIRRQILTLLRGTRLTAGEIAGQFDISRPAISRHLRVLRESGLVRDELIGRQRYYVLDPAPLTELADWIARFDTTTAPGASDPSTQRPWARRSRASARRSREHRLDALETEVYRTRREHRATSADRNPKENTA
ncbi:metalloregulator ArsR/SmtB family transcription factor [Nocardia sp. CA-128927]|uniref:metalloregulator ArsR/SmtB family transcription factor n=1 Tax=Nocardia sp. CA-128927 TaxID=3239975 RepID=UPI003D955AD2